MAKQVSDGERVIARLERIEGLLEDLILFQARSAGVSRAALAKWMGIGNDRIAQVSKVVRSKNKD